MENQESGPCGRCFNANRVYNEAKRQELNLFLICKDGHVLCENCFANLKWEGCPFDRNQVLRVRRPIKGFYFDDFGHLAYREACNLIEKGVELAELRRQVEHLNQIMPQPVPIPQPQNPIKMSQDEIKLLKTELEQYHLKLETQLKQLKSARELRKLIILLIFDTLCSLIQLTSSLLQLYIFISSFGTSQYEVGSIFFYFASFWVAVILINYREDHHNPCKNFGERFCLAFCTPIFYLNTVFLIQIKRMQKYGKKSQTTWIHNFLAFRKINYLLLLGKIIVFLQYFLRFYDFRSNSLKTSTLAFTILQIFALLYSDISYYHLLKAEEDF